ncbi:MAG: hypothetical protein ACTSPI_13545 [Candidatus Heimdallarchaeaceae archaeon]
MTKKLDFLKYLYDKYGDYKIHYVNIANPSENWKTEKLYSKSYEKSKSDSNLRKIMSDEVILDIEEKNHLANIKVILIDKNWKYQVWDTGSRGYHVSLIFPQLLDYPLEARNKVRKYIIKQFGCDESKSSEKTWLATEHTPHFKTGKEKTLLEEYIAGTDNRDNDFTPDILRVAEQAVKELSKPKKKEIIDKEFLKDPLLKYVLNNKITRGDRNNILFKNLAVGLVQAGLENGDIQNYAETIIANCPGKTVSEFMGWVRKAFNDEITQYNKYELNEWCEKHGYPIQYKVTDGEHFILENMSIKDLWNTKWNNYIEAQAVWRDLCFYNMIGTILDERENDLRVHVIFSSFTSSGKDEGINLVHDVLKQMGYVTARPTEVTDRTLLGAVNQPAFEFNQQHDLEEGEIKEVPIRKDSEKTRQVAWRNPVDYGYLKNHHWIGYSEAEIVLKPSGYNRHIQVILRQAMDEKRYVEKGVQGIKVAFYTNTSFLLTTHPLPNIIISLLTNGLFQRCMYYDKKLSEEDKNHIASKILEAQFSSKKEKYDVAIYDKELLKRLKDMKTWYEETKDKIDLEEGLVKCAAEKQDMIKGNYAYLNPEDQDILDAIMRRGIKNAKRVAKLHAITEKRIKITAKDLGVGFRLLDTCVGSVKYMLLNTSPHEKQRFALLNILRKRGELSLMELYAELKRTLGIKSPKKLKEIIQAAEREGMVITKTQGKYKIIAIKEQ